MTNEIGKAEFELEYGDYSATITADGFIAATESLAFRSNHKNFTVTLDDYSGTSTVTVTLVDAENSDAPIPNQQVVLYNDTYGGDYSAVTDENGIAIIEDVPLDDFILEGIDGGSGFRNMPVKVNDATEHFTLKTLSNIATVNLIDDISEEQVDDTNILLSATQDGEYVGAILYDPNDEHFEMEYDVNFIDGDFTVSGDQLRIYENVNETINVTNDRSFAITIESVSQVRVFCQDNNGNALTENMTIIIGTDPTGEDPTQIVASVVDDYGSTNGFRLIHLDDQFAPTTFPTGTYYLLATYDDGENPVLNYSGQITVTDKVTSTTITLTETQQGE